MEPQHRHGKQVLNFLNQTLQKPFNAIHLNLAGKDLDNFPILPYSIVTFRLNVVIRISEI